MFPFIVNGMKLAALLMIHNMNSARILAERSKSKMKIFNMYEGHHTALLRSSYSKVPVNL